MSVQPRDILDLEDVKQLVDTFYAKVREDNMLAPVFNERIQDRWPEHLEKMYLFWQTVLLDEHTYYGAPFPPHAKLQVEHAHFERWVALFNKTVDALFTGQKSDEAKWRGQKMAQIFEIKIEQFKKTGFKSLV